MCFLDSEIFFSHRAKLLVSKHRLVLELFTDCIKSSLVSEPGHLDTLVFSSPGHHQQREISAGQKLADPGGAAGF